MLSALSLSILFACTANSPSPSTPAAPSAEPGRSEQAVAPLRHIEAGDRASPQAILLLHGLGDAPERFIRLLEGAPLQARVLAPAAPTPYRDGYSWFDYDPEDPARTAAGIAEAAAQVAAFIEALDLDRPPIVAGFSQGGMIAAALAVRHPDAIQAAIPLGGTMFPPLLEGGAAQIAPMLALHGEVDVRVPLAPMQQAIERLRARGQPAALRTYPALGHSVSPQMRADLVEALQALLAPCRLLTPVVHGEAITVPFTPLAPGSASIDLTVGSLLRPLPVGADCPPGQQGAEVASEHYLYRHPDPARSYARLGQRGCVAEADLAPSAEVLIPMPLSPEMREQRLFVGNEEVEARCDAEGIEQLRPATAEMRAGVRQVRAAWEESFGVPAPPVAVSEWGYVRLPLTAMSEAEIAAEATAEGLETDLQREKVTTAWGPMREGVPIFSHFTGADARYSDVWGQPAAVAAWLRLAASWAEACPATTERRACTLQFGDLAWYNGLRPDPLGHEDHWPGWCADIRLFRSDGSRYEAFWNQPDDRAGRTEAGGGGYSAELTSAFLRHALGMVDEGRVFFNDPTVIRAVPGVERYPKHDDHIHLCIQPQ